MSNRIYLKNGCEAILHEKLSENRFVIEKITEFVYENETYHEPCGVQEIVSEIFTSPPIDAINSVIKTLEEQKKSIRKEVQELTTQKHSLRNELYNLNEEKKRFSNWIIDLRQWRNAKNIVIFSPNDIAPHILSYNGKGEENINSIVLEIRLDGSRLGKWYSYGGGTSHYIDEKHDIYFDLSEDEIVKITNERSEKIDLSLIKGYKSNNIPEKYQTLKVKNWLKERQQKRNSERVKYLQGEINKHQLELATLNKD